MVRHLLTYKPMGERAGDSSLYFQGPLGSLAAHAVSSPSAEPFSRKSPSMRKTHSSSPGCPTRRWPPWGTSTTKLFRRGFAISRARAGEVMMSSAPIINSSGTSPMRITPRPLLVFYGRAHLILLRSFIQSPFSLLRTPAGAVRWHDSCNTQAKDLLYAIAGLWSANRKLAHSPNAIPDRRSEG